MNQTSSAPAGPGHVSTIAQVPETAEPLAVRIERDIREGRIALPVLPRIALHVQELIEQDAGTPVIVEAIEREPTIAAALVRYANSIAYAGLREVTDLHQAVLRLGHKPVQQTVLALAARTVFDTRDKQTVPRHLVAFGDDGAGGAAPGPARVGAARNGVPRRPAARHREGRHPPVRVRVAAARPARFRRGRTHAPRVPRRTALPYR